MAQTAFFLEEKKNLIPLRSFDLYSSGNGFKMASHKEKNKFMNYVDIRKIIYLLVQQLRGSKLWFQKNRLRLTILSVFSRIWL